jgi:serine/threonine protein kinase/TolA-binding protein
MIGQTVSHYRILSKIGEGAMSVVYVAEDSRLGRQVAVKVLTERLNLPQFRDRMLQEARAISSLNHANIATIHEYGETSEGQPYIVMELVKGPTLEELLRGGGLMLARTLKIVEGIAEGLAEAHRLGIVHRDIKPSNVAVNERGEVKILDFGLAKQLSDPAEEGETDVQPLSPTATGEGFTIGTPLYMSPEQAQGRTIDRRSDLFSLGSLLYECVSGRPAFDDRNAVAVCVRVIRDNPTPPSRFNPEISPELDRITAKALAKKPEERYQTADEMLEDLRNARQRLSTPAQQTPKLVILEPIKPTPSVVTSLIDTFRRPHILIVAFLLTLAVSLLAAWGVSYWGRKVTPLPISREAVNYYVDGVNALRDGTYYKAIRALEKAISIESNFTLAHARLAEAWSELDYTDKAKNELLYVSAATYDGPALPPTQSLYVQAIHLKLSGNSQGAIEKYRAVVEQSPDSEKPAAYVDLGRAYERDGNTNKAIESYTSARELDPQFTAALMRLGVLLGRRLDGESTEKALATFRDAETRYQTLNDLEGQAEVFYERGVLFMARRKIDEARGQLSLGLGKAAAIDNNYQQIKIRMQLSSVACLAGDTAEAKQLASEVMDFAKKNGLEILAVGGLTNLGNTLMARGDLNLAADYLEQALQLARFYKARRGQARAALTLASLYTRHQGKADRVKEYVEQASAIYQQDGYRKYAMQAHAILGHASEQLCDYGAALGAFEQQLKLAEELGDQEQVALAHNGIGIVLNNKEEHPESLKHLGETYRISQILKLRPYIGHALLTRGKALWQLGRYEEAQDSLAEALRIAKEADEPERELLAWLHLSQAQLELSRRHFELAKEESQKALELFGAEYATSAAESKYTKGLAYTLSGATQEGQRLCGEALEDAKRAGSSRSVGGALLALSATMLESGKAQDALAHALEAREIFERLGLQNSEWRALSVAALASKRAGDETTAREYVQRITELLSALQRRWGGMYNVYLQRPDVRHTLARLNQEFGLNI